jgi:anaerobic selenocysteine-containing dehydrogenase/NADPH-dependent glutamate synthase beta subunit-like oxidoreductase/NAD-dependent dihydropyrimidine dehydrogenase PreA subunit
MAYVVTQACIGNKHTSCVDVCPVEAFRDGPEMLYIDPDVCIDCNACLSACPEQAIFPASAVPDAMRNFIALNAEKSQVYPVIRESIGHDVASSRMAAFAGRFAVAGSGPSGFYVAEELLKQMPAAQVDMFERLPTPFGLVRYGVAPDHPRIKSVSSGFERIAQNPRLRFFGNVEIGRDLLRAELLQNYDGVIYATGGSRSRELLIPGADLPNTFGSSTFVGWYNGHPDHAGLAVDLSAQTAVVIGIGNVALDIARMLVLAPQQLAKTDVADEALAIFRASSVREVVLMARRGPAQAAFTPKELEQLMGLANLDLLVEPADLELDAETTAQLEQPEFGEIRQNILLLKEIARRQPSMAAESDRKRIRFMFFHSPESIESDANGLKSLHALRNIITRDAKGRVSAEPDGKAVTIRAGLIVHAIGYQGDVVGDVPFDAQRGVILNHLGRVEGAGSNSTNKEYAAGWIKRGASGVIGSNKQCASDTVAQLLADLAVGADIDATSRAASASDITDLLKKRHVESFDFADWRLLDDHEQALGRLAGRPRRKITDVSRMLEIIRSARVQHAADEQARGSQPVKTHLRTCSLCEAMCGVKITVQGDKILSIAGDPDDPFSGGHICPKGYALQDIHDDPDRLKTPLQKVGGQWLPIGWDEALDRVCEALVGIQKQYGNDAVAGYWGNPSSHNFGVLTTIGKFRKALGSKNLFSGASLDQMPHQLMSYLMFGHGQLFTIPDIDRTSYMLMLGANPAASNGSLMSAGDVLKRLEGIKSRGGKLVLVDPRRTETALYASEHLFIKPGTDPLFLIGLIQHIISTNLYKPAHLTPMLDQFDQLLGLFDLFSMADISRHCGIPEQEIVRIAEEFAAAESAICYGRMGISTQTFSALNHWLINILNILTGNLDRAGGMMFTKPAVDVGIKPSTAGSFGQYGTRVRGLPEFSRELPSAAMAEEMLTPGEGQIKGFICVAGNPVLSVPNGGQMEQALDKLEFMVSIDFYLNETSRHADIILPPTGPLEHEHYDIGFNAIAVRNVAKFSASVFPHGPDRRSDSEIQQGLTRRINCLKNGGLAVDSLPEMTTEQILDFGLKSGPYGKGFTAYESGKLVERKEGLSLKVLKQYPHGLDLGPLQPCLPGHLFTEDKLIRLIPAPIVDDLQRLLSHFSKPTGAQMTLISRRDLRSNNSWMHNSQRLVKGKDRCALLMNPLDAQERGLQDRGRARIVARVGELEVDVRISEDVMPGVVCLPHGWGHDREGVALRVAQTNPGINMNELTDDQCVDSISGNAVFNGVPVEVMAY